MLTSPASTIAAGSTCIPLTSVSTATLASGSMVKQASRIASDMESQSLSGWPAVTDSAVVIGPSWSDMGQREDAPS